MGDPVLIIVSGAPGTGKTTLARRIAATLRIPYLGKDLIKETLFDSLGTRDRAWSQKLGVASIALLFKMIESHLEVGSSVVAESNFYVELDLPRFKQLQGRWKLKTVEVHCETARKVLYKRLEQRDQSGERHPGHETTPLIKEIDRYLDDGAYGPLETGGGLIRVDTTDFEKVSYDTVISAVETEAGL